MGEVFRTMAHMDSSKSCRQQDLYWVTYELSRGAAKQSIQLTIALHDAPIRAHHHNGIRGAIQELAKPRSCGLLTPNVHVMQEPCVPADQRGEDHNIRQ